MVTADPAAPRMRLATPTDAAAIDALMKASTRGSSPPITPPNRRLPASSTSRGWTRCFSRMAPTSSSKRKARSWPAVAGVVATSSTAGRPSRRAATGCSIRPPKLPTSGRCSCGPTGRVEGSARILDACEAAARDEGFGACRWGRRCRVSALCAVRLCRGRPGTITLPDGTVVEYVTMEKPIALRMFDRRPKIRFMSTREEDAP